MTTYELTADQMEELKQNHLCMLYEELGKTPSYGELADARFTISDETIHEYYSNDDFTNDDFFCTAFTDGNETHTVECFLEAYNPDNDNCYFIGTLFLKEYDSYFEAHRAYMRLNAETTTLRVYMAAMHPDVSVYVGYSIDDDVESYPLT